MENFSERFGELVEQRLKALNTNAFALEQKRGLPPDSIRNVMRSEKKSGPTLSRAEEICAALDLEFYIGPKRTPPGLSEGEVASDLGRAEALRAGYLPIPWHHSANRNGSAEVAFASAWLDSERIDIGGLSAVPIEVSHIAAILSGSTALISPMPRSLAKAAWAFKRDGRIQVADIEFMPRVTVLAHAGPNGGTMVLIDEDRSSLDLLGKVVWVGRKF